MDENLVQNSQNENFEDKINEIDKLLNSLNDENITLLESVNLYKKGILLVKEARLMLEKAQLEISEISENG